MTHAELKQQYHTMDQTFCHIYHGRWPCWI